MTTCLGKSCSFGLPRVPLVNCCQYMYLVVSLLVLRAGCGIWLYRFLIIAYLFTLFECHFSVIIRSIYLNTTENSLTHKNSLHTTIKKTHSLQRKRQIILCLSGNYCLAIHETPLKSTFSCAKNSADRELSVKMRGLIMYMFRPSPKALYLRSFAIFFDPVVDRPSLFSSFSRIESVCVTNKVRNSRIESYFHR